MVHRFATASLLALAVAGCGSSEDGRRASVPVPAPATGPAGPAPSVTAGQVGDATNATADGQTLLDGGGATRPGEGAPPAGVREGVDGAADCGAVDAEPSVETLDPVGASTLCLLNVERTSRGLAALTRNGKLDQAATVHAQDMVAKQFFGHQSPSGSAPVDRIRASGYIPTDRAWTVGENLAWGSGVLATPAAIVRAWMNSPGHRDNILKAGYKEIGLGLVAGVPKAGITGGATFATTFGGIEDPAPAPSAAPVAVQPVSAVASATASKPKAKPKKKVAKKKKKATKKVKKKATARAASARRR